MARDNRYKTLKVMIETENVKSLQDFFMVIPKTVIAGDLGINYTRFLARLNKPMEFTIDEILRLALLIDIDKKVLINLVLTEIETKKIIRKKK